MGFFSTFIISMFLLDIRVRYILLSVLIFLSFLHYFNDPLKYSSANECIALPCKEYSLIINLLSFTFLSAMTVSMGILNKSIFVPTYWFVVLIVIGYFLILIDWRNSKIVVPRKDRITPPPEGYIPKNRRLILVSSILILFFFLFLLNYLSHRIPPTGSELSDILVWNAFGGIEKKRGAFMAGWLSILGLVTASMNIYFTDKFEPYIFNLPNSWRL